MTIQQFNKKFKRQGGIKKLVDMRYNCYTLRSISEHFHISKERVRQWMVLFFGEKYDPRIERKERKIRNIELLIEKYGVEKTKDIYIDTNKNYLKEAINRIINRKKYEDK